MVEEGKITAEEGAELLDALRNKERFFSGQFFKSGFAKDMAEMAKDMAKMGRNLGRSVFSNLGGTEVGELFERELEVSPDGELLLKNFSGEITVESWEKPAVRIQATKYARGRTEEEARENARQIGIDVRQDKHILRIDTKIPFPGHAQAMGGRVDYEISIPQRLNLKLQSMSGDVDIAGGVKPEADYLLKTLSGNLKMRIPRDASVQIEALSRSGHISYTLPLKIEKKSSHELHGILGEGKVRIKLITLSGDIPLEHRE